MRILTLCWEYPPKSVGGLARHVDDLTREMARQGAECFILTAGGGDVLPEENLAGVHVFRAAPFSLPAKDFTTWIMQLNFSFIEKAVEIIRRCGPFDLIHAHDWLVAYAARCIKHAWQLPLVSTIHATEYGRNQGLHNDAQRYISDVEWWLTFESWQVIVCSQYMKDELQKVFQLPDNKISIIPNGVDTAGFQKVPGSFRRQDYALDGEKIVFFVGRLVREKGVQVLLDAAPKILRYCPEAKFIIAGTGPSEEYLKAKSHMINIDAKILFTGYIDDLTRNGLYKSAQAAVFPSLYEPFGIVALEGMAARTPLVVSDVGGMGEIVLHGVDGLKAFPGNPNSLADNIIQLLKDEELADTLRCRAWEKASADFNWGKIATRTRDVYASVCREAVENHWPPKEMAIMLTGGNKS